MKDMANIAVIGKELKDFMEQRGLPSTEEHPAMTFFRKEKPKKKPKFSASTVASKMIDTQTKSNTGLKQACAFLIAKNEAAKKNSISVKWWLNKG